MHALMIEYGLNHKNILEELCHKKGITLTRSALMPGNQDSLWRQKFDFTFISVDYFLKETVLAQLVCENVKTAPILIHTHKRETPHPGFLLPEEFDALSDHLDRLCMHCPAIPIIAESPSMKHILEEVQKIAPSHASVFIHGESGTGKEVIAHAIHFQSQRAHAPFIKVNCAAIPDTLIESEFFGHEKGAFTGAIQRRIGRFEMAHQGTLLLDEISEIPLALQAKLLRAIQEKEIERIGGAQPIQVDIRFISTSNRPMKETLKNRAFREDLYYRLNVIPLFLPPLRERKEDILPLARHFLHKNNPKNPKPLSEAAQHALWDYHWPGNVRELANAIERATVICTKEWIQPDHLGLESSNLTMTQRMHEQITLSALEKSYILHTLAKCEQNRTKTAKALGISLRTLRNKLARYGSE